MTSSTEWRTESSLANLPAVVAARGSQRPSARAVVAPDGVLTYAALLEQMNRVAAGLQANDVKAGDVIGVLLEPACQLPAVLLGILLCGAAFVPLNL